VHICIKVQQHWIGVGMFDKMASMEALGGGNGLGCIAEMTYVPDGCETRHGQHMLVTYPCLR